MRPNLLALALLILARPAMAVELRVCADPNNMPFSNSKGEGFENKLALIIAGDLGETAHFVFQRQTENFLDRGLKAGLCDAVMGVPAGLDEVAVTRPYYVKGFMISGGDYARGDPSARLIEAVSDGTIDVAAVWGPIGGYYAKRAPVPLTVAPITGTEAFAPLSFRYAIAIGVRQDDGALRARLDRILAKDKGAIRALLQSYGVPLVSPQGLSHE